MLRYLITAGSENIAHYVIQILLCVPIIFFSLSLHETAHGYVAYKMGDPTAKNLGRLTLNPIKHLDPIGFLCMLLAGFGWAKPVPINSRNFKKPRYGIALTSFAGPASNLILAFIFILITRFSISPLVKMTATAISDGNTVVASLLFYLCLLLYLAAQLNLTLAVFNLIPIPPLDGSKILYMFLPANVYFKIAPYERYISIAFMILLATGVISPILGTVTDFLMNVMFGILGISADEVLSAIGYLSMFIG